MRAMVLDAPGRELREAELASPGPGSALSRLRAGHVRGTAVLPVG